MSIARMTADCEREDCSIVYDGSATTLLGWSQTYDKRGRPKHRDPNMTTGRFHCERCSKRWKVESKDGEADKISRDDVKILRMPK